MKQTMWVSNDIALQSALGKIRKAYADHGKIVVTVGEGSRRSIPQNDLAHVWYTQLERELPQQDALGHKCDCKLWFGVPILRNEEPHFRESYDKAIKPLDYSTKLEVMKILPVTSIMTKAQKEKYLNAMQKYFHKKHDILLEAK